MAKQSKIHLNLATHKFGDIVSPVHIRLPSPSLSPGVNPEIVVEMERVKQRLMEVLGRKKKRES